MRRRRWSGPWRNKRAAQETSVYFSMFDEEILAQMNGKYVCPADAGPAWRAAVAAGIDMSLIEHALTLTPRPRATLARHRRDRKSTRLNSSHVAISYAVFCLKKK